MTFSPVLPATGLIGWNFLTRTIDQQKEALSNDGALKREITYFEENFSNIQSAADLVADRTLLKVALGAFGLQDDLGNKFFVQKIIEDGTTERTALSNLLSDTRYKEFASAFDFSSQSINSDTFISGIVSDYRDQSFETAIGEQNSDFRLALNLERTFDELGARNTSNDTKWFTILGSPPLRTVFETAFRLPTAFGSLPIDTQLETIKERARKDFGTDSVAELSTEESQENIVKNFLLQSQVAEISTLTSQSTALTLLQGL